ncbi:ThiS family protein [Candidatus Gugararchaeum adminiculabundum]|nr:ThiS family protein [Candidatus Gugararchaeum adminiculabundum]
MLVRVNSEKRKLGYSGDVKGLLKLLKVQKETVVVAKNGKIVPETETVGGNDEVELIKVIFGG